MHVEAPPPSPRALRPDMPPELERVILTALAKPPDQRFASAMAMSAALQHATAQLPPDQWRPLTPPAARPSASPWAPTPPSSWSGPGSRPPTPQPPMPPPYPTPQPPSLGNASTLSAGQVSRGGRPASRRALWIGLAAIVMIGGGITAGALLASRGGDPGTANPGNGSGSVAVIPVAPGKTKDDPWAARGQPPKADDSKTEDKNNDKDSDKDDKDDDDDDASSGAPGANPADEAVAAALKQLDATIKSLPPDQRKRLAGYRGLSKLPPAERLKRLRQLTQQAMAQGMAEAQNGMAEAQKAMAEA